MVRWAGLESRGLRVIGDVPQSLPPVALPLLDVSASLALLPGALAVAWIGLAEAISISKSVAALSGDRVDSDREFVGQGLANIAVSLFSGMPVSGSLTRTQLLYRAGATSRWANILAGLLVMAIVLLFAPLVRSIPVAALAGCLILIAVQMVDWKHVVMTLRATSADAIAMLATFVTALFFALDTAVFVGIGVSLLLFLRHMQATHLSELVYDERDGFRELGEGGRRPIPEISLVHLEGDLFFGAAETLEQEILRIAGREGLLVLILRMKRAYYVDATFIEVLLKLHAYMLGQGRLLLISGTTPEIERTLRQAGLLAAIGAENTFTSTPVLFQATGRALARAVEYVNQKAEKGYCYSCRERVSTPLTLAGRRGDPSKVSPVEPQ